MQAPDPILGLMDRFTAAINAHDLDAVLPLVTNDVVFRGHLAAACGNTDSAF